MVEEFHFEERGDTVLPVRWPFLISKWWHRFADIQKAQRQRQQQRRWVSSYAHLCCISWESKDLNSSTLLPNGTNNKQTSKPKSVTRARVQCQESHSTCFYRQVIEFRTSPLKRVGIKKKRDEEEKKNIRINCIPFFCFCLGWTTFVLFSGFQVIFQIFWATLKQCNCAETETSTRCSQDDLKVIEMNRTGCSPIFRNTALFTDRPLHYVP